jgi:Holliday junction resolvase RusA-like endonuclease
MKEQYKDYPLDCPLMVEITFRFVAAKSNKDTYCVNRKDLDNLSKGILDSGNKLIWSDDSQIVYLVAFKIYSDSEGVDLNVFELS